MYAKLGKSCTIQQNVILGLRYVKGCKQAIIGDHAVIRWGTIIYADVEIGDDFKTGHSVVIREKTKIGNRVVVGSNTVIDGNVEIGDFVKIETNVYIPTHVKIGSHVFIGPAAVLTNDKYPQRLRDEYEPNGPVLEEKFIRVPGISIEYMRSPKFLDVDGGWNRVVWMPQAVKDRVKEFIPPDMVDKIPTENDAKSIEELKAFLESKSHPVVERWAALAPAEEVAEAPETAETATDPFAAELSTVSGTPVISAGMPTAGGFKITLKNVKIRAEKIIIKRKE